MTPRRSSRGSGTYHQLPSGRWRSQGTDPTGRRRSTVHPPTIETKRQAVEAHQRFMVRIGAEDAVGPGKRTVNDLIDEWWKQKQDDPLAATSIYRYEQHIKIVKHHLGTVPLARVRPLLLDRFYREPDITPHRAGGIRATILHPAFDRAVDWGWMPDNPVKRSRLPKADKREMHPPTHEAVLAFTRRLFDDPTTEWFGVFVHLLAATGCRKGEVLGLRWEDIDWATGTISIRRNVAITPELGVFVKEPKTVRGRRTIKVEEGTLVLLRAFISPKAIGAANRYIFPGDPRHGDLPLSPNVLDKAFRVAKAKHGFPYRMHDIRHMHATGLMAAGIPIANISRRLGHAQAAVTMNVYAHALPAGDDEAARVSGAWLAGPTQ